MGITPPFLKRLIVQSDGLEGLALSANGRSDEGIRRDAKKA
jgi:hypothetical protein